MSNRRITIAGAPVNSFSRRANTLHANHQRLANEDIPAQRRDRENADAAVATARTTHSGNLKERKRLADVALDLEDCAKRARKEATDYGQIVDMSAADITQKEHAAQRAAAAIVASEHRLNDELPVEERVHTIAGNLQDQSIEYEGQLIDTFVTDCVAGGIADTNAVYSANDVSVAVRNTIQDIIIDFLSTEGRRFVQGGCEGTPTFPIATINALFNNGSDMAIAYFQFCLQKVGLLELVFERTDGSIVRPGPNDPTVLTSMKFNLVFRCFLKRREPHLP